MTEHCHCFRCTKMRVALDPLPPDMLVFGQVDPRMARMFLCETCGNKRCPHAADHRLNCTRSNAPGQPGSLYEHGPMRGRTNDL
jgi:hypothetical protein